MEGLSKAGQVGGAEHTRDTQEAQFKGYSVEIGTPSGVKSSDVPEVHIRSNRSLLQMLRDTVTDWTSGLSVGTTKESRKLDAMIAYIRAGEGFGVEGKSDEHAGDIGKRALALEQVLTSPSASSTQKKEAAEAFEGALKNAFEGTSDRLGIDFHGRPVRELCSKLVSLEQDVGREDKALLGSIKHELGQQMLKAGGAKIILGGRLDTAENRLESLRDYKEKGGLEGINGQISILESAVTEQKQKESFNTKLSPIKDELAAYTKATGGEPQAGEAHDKHVMAMVSSLKELYQEVLDEFGSIKMEDRGGQRESDLKGALRSLKGLAKDIVTARPRAGSHSNKKTYLGPLQAGINADLKAMGFGRYDGVFLGSTKESIHQRGSS